MLVQIKGGAETWGEGNRIIISINKSVNEGLERHSQRDKT